MSTDQFEDPASIAAINYNDLNGRLLLFTVDSYEPHINTVHTQPGEQNPAVRVALTILDGPEAGTHHEDVLVFPKVLVGQLRSRLGKTVLGRLGQGEARQGFTAPWRLNAATEDDKRVAREALARDRVHSSAPPAPGQQPATAPAGQYQSQPPF